MKAFIHVFHSIFIVEEKGFEHIFHLQRVIALNNKDLVAGYLFIKHVYAGFTSQQFE
jgi:hypothetical protein